MGTIEYMANKETNPHPISLPLAKGEGEGGGRIWWVTGCRPNPPYIGYLGNE